MSITSNDKQKSLYIYNFNAGRDIKYVLDEQLNDTNKVIFKKNGSLYIRLKAPQIIEK